jgi:hypothetical protein
MNLFGLLRKSPSHFRVRHWKGKGGRTFARAGLTGDRNRLKHADKKPTRGHQHQRLRVGNRGLDCPEFSGGIVREPSVASGKWPGRFAVPRG